jgi:PAS domain S-box-containing protein
MSEQRSAREANVIEASMDPLSGTPEPAQGGVLPRELFDAVDALVVVLDLDGRILLFNRACEQASGYGASDVVGRMFWEVLTAPEQANAVRALIRRLAQGETSIRHACGLIANDGSRLSVAWTLTLAKGATEGPNLRHRDGRGRHRPQARRRRVARGGGTDPASPRRH